jgi:NADH dehydrogenase/NADH:ubiquinone oxidoreductase subunit G
MSKKITVQQAGHIGGTTRAQRLSPEKRTEIAIKASKAAAARYALLSPEEKTALAKRANLAPQAAKKAKKKAKNAKVF